MRIIKTLLSFLVILAILGVVSFLVARQVLLFWGTNQIESSLIQLKSISQSQTGYIRQCKLKGNPRATNVIHALQLRFTSSREYVTEVICDQFPNDPILIKKETLPPLVTKSSGYSGVIWGTEASGVELQVLGVSAKVGALDLEPQRSSKFEPGQLQPQTTCAGYSQICCQPETQQGLGNLNAQVSDCSENCFTSCQNRPVILSFSSDPFYDQNTRTLKIHRSETVTFGVVASSTQKLPPSLMITYGDGQQEQQTAFNNQFTHLYSCSSSSCTYLATVSAQDQMGIKSAITPLTKIIVIVQ